MSDEIHDLMTVGCPSQNFALDLLCGIRWSRRGVVHAAELRAASATNYQDDWIIKEERSGTLRLLQRDSVRSAGRPKSSTPVLSSKGVGALSLGRTASVFFHSLLGESP